jgi:Na+/H+-dicarboxylate symporter
MRTPSSLNVQILLGAGLGIACGISLNLLQPQGISVEYFLGACETVGSVFVSLLKMVLIPLIFTSISVGLANLQEHTQMGKAWKITLGYFLLTSCLSVGLGLLLVNIFEPGKGIEIDFLKDKVSAPEVTEGLTFIGFWKQFFTNLFVNPIEAMSKGAILPTVTTAIILGIAMIKLREKAARLRRLLKDSFDVIMTIVGWIMRLTPIGIFALLTKLLAKQNLEIISQVGLFIAVVLLGTFIHGLVTLPLFLKAATGRSITEFFKSTYKALLLAFSTSSSSATLPVSIECTEKNLKVDKNIARFVLPIGSTINMDGSALYEAIAAIFIANIAGISLDISQQLTVFAMAIVGSIGAPGIPSAGMVTMIMVLQAVGLPAEGVVLLLPIDRLLDTFRTAVNVEGDIIGACIVDHNLKP